MAFTPVDAEQFAAAGGTAGWRFDGEVIRGRFGCGSFPSAGALVAEISDVAERIGHHPDVWLRYPATVDLEVTTHDAGCVTTLDVDLARAVTSCAVLHGAEPLS